MLIIVHHHISVRVTGRRNISAPLDPCQSAQTGRCVLEIKCCDICSSSLPRHLKAAHLIRRKQPSPPTPPTPPLTYPSYSLSPFPSTYPLAARNETLQEGPPLMLAPRRRPVHLLVTVAFFAFLFFFYRKTAHEIYHAQFPGSTRSKPLIEDDRANATLGFGAVAVVSKDGSSRRPLLLQAANVTNILLTIPSQPQWTDEDVKKFHSSEESQTGPSIGSIYAWLGHHNVLRWYEFLHSRRVRKPHKPPQPMSHQLIFTTSQVPRLGP